MKKRLDTLVPECQKFVQLYEKEYSVYANNARTVYKRRKARVLEELSEKEDIKKVRIGQISRFVLK